MAISCTYAALVFALLCAWILASRARPNPDTAPSRPQALEFSPRTRFLMPEDLPELFQRPYRVSDKIRPRSTRVGDELFVARGYGKRSGKAQQMPLMIPRGYGKRSEESVERLMCLITKCNRPEMDAEAAAQPTED